MSSYKLIYTEKALADVKEADKWYSLQKKGLGKKFRDDVLIVIQMIEKNPFLLLSNMQIFVPLPVKCSHMQFIMKLMKLSN